MRNYMQLNKTTRKKCLAGFAVLGLMLLALQLTGCAAPDPRQYNPISGYPAIGTSY
jgi:hypothetical protein